MEQDAFSAGVEPGGLRSQNDIRLLICYMLANVREPLNKNDIVRILQDTGLANYFETSSALADILRKQNADTLPENPELCVANSNTTAIAAQLESSLPHSVRDKAVEATLNLLALAKRQRENQVDIVKEEDGYSVICHISGGNRDLMSFTIWVPNLQQARTVKKNFHKQPELVYQVMLCMMTDNRDYLRSLLHL